MTGSNWFPLSSFRLPTAEAPSPPSNTRTAKTAWKRKRRRANLPRAWRKRLK